MLIDINDLYLFLCQADIERAVNATKRSIAVCNKFRKKSTLLNKVNYNKLTRGKKFSPTICAQSKRCSYEYLS